MPEPWRGRLLALLETVPQVIPVFRSEGCKHQDLCREVIHEHVDQTCDVTAQYRLDDDDGLGATFIEKTRELYGNMKPFFEQSEIMALDYTRGFIVQSTAKKVTVRTVSMRFWAPGMVIFQRPDSNRALMDYNHLKIWHYMPTLTWQQEPMFIRGAHHENDSNLAGLGRRTRSFDFNHKNPNRYLRRTFGISMNEIQKIWQMRQSHFMGSPESKSVHIRKLKLVT